MNSPAEISTMRARWSRRRLTGLRVLSKAGPGRGLPQTAGPCRLDVTCSAKCVEIGDCYLCEKSGLDMTQHGLGSCARERIGERSALLRERAVIGPIPLSCRSRDREGWVLRMPLISTTTACTACACAAKTLRSAAQLWDRAGSGAVVDRCVE
jgi:hypothetical protein